MFTEHKFNNITHRLGEKTFAPCILFYLVLSKILRSKFLRKIFGIIKALCYYNKFIFVKLYIILKGGILLEVIPTICLKYNNFIEGYPITT